MKTIFDQVFFVLKGHNPVPVNSMEEWGAFYNNIANRRVASTDIEGMRISTVFLGLDHNWSGGRPILFETMVFDQNNNDVYMERYHTWEEAEAGHQAICLSFKEKFESLNPLIDSIQSNIKKKPKLF